MATAQPAAPQTTPTLSYSRLILPIGMILLAILLYSTMNTAVLGSDFNPAHFLELAGILFLAGKTSGLTGFAFSAIGALTLFILAPITAVPLLQALSACNQVLSVGKLRKDMPKTLKEWFPYGPGPAILGGLAGVQAGVWVLNNLPGPKIMIILGILITLYSIYSLFKPAALKIHGYASGSDNRRSGRCSRRGDWWLHRVPGLTVVVWTGLRGLSKGVQSRHIVQPFILTLQLVSAPLPTAFNIPKTLGFRSGRR